MSSETTFENVPNLVFFNYFRSIHSFHSYNIYRRNGSPVTRKSPVDHTEYAEWNDMLFSISTLTSSRQEGWVYDGCEVKQPLHSHFIFQNINGGIIEIMTSLDFSNESVKMVLSLSAISIGTSSLRASYIWRTLNKGNSLLGIKK